MKNIQHPVLLGNCKFRHSSIGCWNLKKSKTVSVCDLLAKISDSSIRVLGLVLGWILVMTWLVVDHAHKPSSCFSLAMSQLLSRKEPESRRMVVFFLSFSLFSRSHPPPKHTIPPLSFSLKIKSKVITTPKTYDWVTGNSHSLPMKVKTKQPLGHTDCQLLIE